MFRRLAEDFETQGKFNTSQQTYFNALPNMVLSNTSGLPSFNKAIGTASETGSINYQPYAVPHPNQIFTQALTPELKAMAKKCAEGTIDDLLSNKSSDDTVGCGWIYTPPATNSPYPVVSRGALGTPTGPITVSDLPAYKKWFFDLQE